MKSIRASFPLALLLLTGCVTGPDHTPPETPLPAKFAEGGNRSNGDVTTVAWWTAFNDSRLTAYIQTGISQNLDVQQALERINAAEANVVSAGAGGLPSLLVGGSHTTSQTKGSLNSAAVRNTSAGSLQASWILDIFGRYRRATESATATLEATQAAADAAKLSFLSQVASAYIDVRYYQERIAIARKNLKSRRETLELTRLQLEAGAASRLDVVQAEGLVNSTLADIPGLETAFRRAAHRIATLLGMPASSLIDELQKGGSRQPVARFNVKSGIPADVIRNRPDIRAAERQLAASVASIGVAESRLYPSIELGGSISPSYVRVSGGARGTINTWSFGPSLSLPIFDGGAIRANIDASKSDSREKYLAWKQNVLGAVEEVENALAAVSRDNQTTSALRATLRSYEEALSLATASYRDGASSLLDVLDAQRNVATAEASLAAAVRQTAQDYVALSIATGGGYAAVGSNTVMAKK